MDKRRKGQKIIYGYIHSDLVKPLRIVAPEFYRLRVAKVFGIRCLPTTENSRTYCPFAFV